MMALRGSSKNAWLARLLEAADGELSSRLARLPEWVDGAYALIVATAAWPMA